jgi:hypothetical protein
MKLYRLNQLEFRSWRDVAAREQLKRRIYTQHGQSQVRAPSGRILGTVRAPEKSRRVPIEKSIARGAHHAVSPAECVCREWQKPPGKGGEHHPICLHKAHWEAQQARSPDLPRERALRTAQSAAEAEKPSTPLANDVLASTAAPPAEPETPPEPEPAVPKPAGTAPEDCVCQEWAGVVRGKHHTLCTFRVRWERAHPSPTPTLVELETGKVVREASQEEVEASKQKEAEDGVGAIELSDGKLYYVKHR